MLGLKFFMNNMTKLETKRRIIICLLLFVFFPFKSIAQFDEYDSIMSIYHPDLKDRIDIEYFYGDSSFCYIHIEDRDSQIHDHCGTVYIASYSEPLKFRQSNVLRFENYKCLGTVQSKLDILSKIRPRISDYEKGSNNKQSDIFLVNGKLYFIRCLTIAYIELPEGKRSIVDLFDEVIGLCL